MILVFDTETTGLIPRDDEIIQFSAIDGDGNVLLNEYIRPSRHTSFPEASEVNGIYYDDLKDKPEDDLKDFILHRERLASES